MYLTTCCTSACVSRCRMRDSQAFTGVSHSQATNARTSSSALHFRRRPSSSMWRRSSSAYRSFAGARKSCSPCSTRPRRRSATGRFDAPTTPIELLQYLLRFRGKRAEAHLLAALHGHERVSLKAIAQKIGWPVASTRTLYRKLELRGEAVPPLANARSGKRLSVTCPHCLRVRSLTPAVVLTLTTDVCFECLHRPPIITPNKLVAICPDCGAKRLLYPSEVAERSVGLDTPCRTCAMARGRAAGRTRGKRSPV